MLTTKAELGKVLGRNIERAAAGWTLVLSLIMVAFHPLGIVYQFMNHFMALELWAWLFGVLAATRVVTLIVNGWWPVTLQVRIAFSLATLVIVWGTLTAAFWAVSIGPQEAAAARFLPGVVLAPFAISVELLCFLALRSRLETIRGVARDNVGRSDHSDSDRAGQPAAGSR